MTPFWAPGDPHAVNAFKPCQMGGNGLALRVCDNLRSGPFFNAHEALDTYFRTHEHYDLDEIFTALNIAGALGLIYSVLRIKDMSREIQRRQTAEKNVDWIACHDPLTELPNRRYLASTLLNPQIIPCKDGTAIFSIDLDGFKKVNDLLGHDQEIAS